MVVVLLLKFIFFVIATLSNVITRLIFSTIAYVLVLIIQAFKVPGEVIQVALEELADAIRGCFEYFMEILLEEIGSLISSAFDHFVKAVTESAVTSGSAIGGLVEKTRASFDGLLKSLPEIFVGVSELVSTIISILWKNYIDALGYVTENA